MPLYSYKCDLCGRETDEVRKADDRHDTEPCQVEVPTKGIARALGRKSKPCKGTLRRDEGSEVNARMDHRWQP